MPITFLEGERLYLRPLTEADLNDAYVQWLNDAEVCAHNRHATFPYTMEKMRDFYHSLEVSDRQIVLAAVSRDGDMHVGNLSLQSIDWVSRSAEFAILMGNKSFWNKGYGFEAAWLVCDYAFQRLNLHRIYCGTLSGNDGMKRLAAKLRMRPEGVRRDAVYKNGDYVDVLEFGVLRDEFYAERTA